MRKGEELKTPRYASAAALYNDRLPHSWQVVKISIKLYIVGKYTLVFFLLPFPLLLKYFLYPSLLLLLYYVLNRSISYISIPKIVAIILLSLLYIVGYISSFILSRR